MARSAAATAEPAVSVAIVDYGMGNVRSVANALRALDCSPAVTADPDELAVADGIVLPGVGAFGDGMRNLRERGLVEALDREVRERGKPILGLCLGMQLVTDVGTEYGRHQGLGWIRGSVDRLQPSDGLRVPHIGWNDVRFASRNGLFEELGESAAFYFVHSYVLRPDDPSIVSGTCDYGGEFAASLEAGNIFGTQFHPEKSQRAGLAVLRRFLELCSRHG